MEFKETGYTPGNLKQLINESLPNYHRQRDYVAEVLNVSVETVDQW
jgi:hypothetical protein